MYEYVEEETQYKDEHGNPKKRKVKKLKKRELPIGEFHEKIYKQFVLVDDKYHGNLFRLLNVCRLERLEKLTPGDVESIRDFSEKLAAQFPNQPQFLHWQNTSVTIEVSVLTAFLKDAVDRYNGTARSSEADTEKPKDEARFDMSDFYMQEAPVVNTDEMIASKIESGELRKKVRGRPGVLREKVDGCGKQYWSGRALYLSTKISKRRSICIDRMREAPGHGKDKADGHGGVLKRFLRAWMRRHGSTSLDEKPLVEAASFGPNDEKLSVTSALVEVCKREFGAGVQGGMNQARQAKAKMEKRTFHEYTSMDVEDVLGLGDFESTNASLMTAEEKKQKLPHSTFKAYHNSRADPHLAKDHTDESARIMMRRWPCGCKGCKRQLEEPLCKDRYANGKARKYPCEREAMYGELNDWKNVLLKRKNVDEDGDDDGTDEDAHLSMEERIEELRSQIEDGGHGAYQAIDPKAAGEKGANYYIVRWKGSPYQLVKAETIDGIQCKAGDYVAKAQHSNLVFGPDARPRWYTENPAEVRVPLESVLHADLSMAPAQNMKMHGSKVKMMKEALDKGAFVLSEEEHNDIMEELHARDMGDEEEE